MAETDVYKVAGNQVEVDVGGRQVRFAVNPETDYALVPASMYATETEAMDALRNADCVDGIFNHEAISEL